MRHNQNGFENAEPQTISLVTMSISLKTIATSVPICPHCGWEDEDWWDGKGQLADGDEYEQRCCNCQKSFTVLYEIEFYFTTEPVDKAIEP